MELRCDHKPISQLPTSDLESTTSAVETTDPTETVAVEVTISMVAIPSVKLAPAIITSFGVPIPASTRKFAAVTVPPASAIAVPWPTIESAAIISAVVKATSIVAMEPWPGTDEDAVYKVAWSIIAIRRASIRIIIVVAVGTI